MSFLRLNKVAKPSSPAVNKAMLFYDSAGPGFGAPVAMGAVDENGNEIMLGHFLVLDYRLLKVSILTAASGTWTPTNGCRAAYVELVGGGGAGGGAATSATQVSVGGGGGGGAYSASWLTGLSATVAFVNGAGGTAGAAGASGNNGGDTTWGVTTIVAKGGSGGAVMAAGTTLAVQVGGAGGVAGSGTGDMKLSGGVGGDGIRLSTTQGWSGRGGIAPAFGVEGASQVVSGVGTAGTNATATCYGSGGGGAATISTSAIGGTGAPGIIRVSEYA